MGVLSHYLEEEGLPTTHISLIREHTQAIQPPRALWVSFEMGRPFGLPNNPAFQTRVLLAALRLFLAPSGPIIEDFPEDAPEASKGSGVWACPIDLAPVEEISTETDEIIKAFKREINQLRSWYDLGAKERGRTTVGVSGIDLDTLVDFISSFLKSELPESPNPDLSLATALRWAMGSDRITRDAP